MTTLPKRLSEATGTDRCPVCGETDPSPAWLCIYRLCNVAEAGKPCDYSREGSQRVATALLATIPQPDPERRDA